MQAQQQPARSCGLDKTRIGPHLYQGSRPPTGGSVANCGFDVLVLCAKEWQLEGAYPGVEVMLCPLDDSGAPMTEKEWQTANRVAARVARRVASGKRCMVTCMQGRNRSGLVVALALRALTGMPGGELIAHIQRRRPNALCNRYFNAALLRLR